MIRGALVRMVGAYCKLGKIVSRETAASHLYNDAQGIPIAIAGRYFVGFLGAPVIMTTPLKHRLGENRHTRHSCNVTKMF